MFQLYEVQLQIKEVTTQDHRKRLHVSEPKILLVGRVLPSVHIFQSYFPNSTAQGRAVIRFDEKHSHQKSFMRGCHTRAHTVHGAMHNFDATFVANGSCRDNVVDLSRQNFNSISDYTCTVHGKNICCTCLG